MQNPDCEKLTGQPIWFLQQQQQQDYKAEKETLFLREGLKGWVNHKQMNLIWIQLQTNKKVKRKKNVLIEHRSPI